MKPYFRLGQLIIIVSLFFVSCTPTVVPNPTALPLPAPPLVPLPPPLGSMGNLPLSVPDMYFVIDESDSMILEDLPKKGGACDPDELRYAISLFMVRILKNWADQGVANDPNLYLLLKNEQGSAQIPAPITPDQMIEKLTDRLINPQTSNVQPFDAEKKTDSLQAVFDAAKDNDYVFLFTDGDFRKKRPEGDPDDENALDTSEKVAYLFENKGQHANTFVFLLCTRRIESPNNPFIKKTWKDLRDKQQAIVYGIEPPDLSDKTILSDTISKMLSDWLGDWNNRSDNGYATRGWGWFVGGNLSPVSNVIPDLLRLRYGAISFDKAVLEMNATSSPTIRLQVDTRPIPELDTGFPYIDDFIRPAEQCSPHRLEFDQNTLGENTFYWWWADVPIFSTESNQPITLYNRESKNYTFNFVVGSSLKDKGSEILKPTDLNEFSNCLTFFAILGDKNYELKYQEGGKLLWQEMRNPFSEELIPLPIGNGIVPLAVQGDWYSSQQGLFSVDLLSQSDDTKRVKIRYYPVIGNNAPLSTTPTPLQETSQKIKIPLDFFEEKYYPQEDFSKTDWLPTVKFGGDDCNPGFTQPVKPPYPPTGETFANFAVKIIEQESSGILIRVYLNDNPQTCKHLTLSWNNWPKSNEDWQAPPKIELKCTFENNTFECK